MPTQDLCALGKAAKTFKRSGFAPVRIRRRKTSIDFCALFERGVILGSLGVVAVYCTAFNCLQILHDAGRP